MEWNDVTSFYSSNVKGTDLEKFLAQTATQAVVNKIVPQSKSPSSVVSPTPQIIQVQGDSASVGGISRNTWIMIGIGGAVALVAVIVLVKK